MKYEKNKNIIRTFRITEEQFQFIQAQGNRSAAVRSLIDKAMAAAKRKEKVKP